MERQDQVSYLANIYRIVLVDGQSDRREEKAFDVIAREMGAGYFEVKEAKELAAADQYDFRPVSRWSDQIRNLEDMLLVAHLNGAIHPEEKSLVLAAAGEAGINNRQFDVIKAEVKQRSDKLS
ncbi:MAG: hypothetical protein KDA63_08520 [Planctomycetales bacterium]|nr:hypothetical protein [Planctomycetales bacterium]